MERRYRAIGVLATWVRPLGVELMRAGYRFATKRRCGTIGV